MQRPDLTNVDPEVLAYIEFLEKKAGGARASRAATTESEPVELSPERAAEALPAEHETNINILTVTKGGIGKRTYRHLYTRQHRGGMGVFGMDLNGTDFPVVLSTAEENQNLLFFTNRARVYRQSINVLSNGPVNAKGNYVVERLALEPEETVIAVLPEQAKGYVALCSEGGRVRSLRHHLFGEHMRPGTAVYNVNEFGPLASACWTPGDAELFVVTRGGMAIRFAEKSISPQGDQGIRLSGDDKVAGLTPVYPDSGVFILSADGRGTVRLMSGFAPNKSPGGSGKIAIKSSKVVGATTVDVNDDVFIISRLGKVIRFPADELPSTEGVVQGVNCMGLRGDEAVAMLKAGPIY
jgi:DNA gyrase subunit A